MNVSSKIRSFMEELKCEKGASLLEFALVFPILITFIFTTIDIGFMMIVKSCLQTGVTAAARSVSMGGGNPSSIITQYAGGFINTAQLGISIQSYPSFSSVAGPNPSQQGTINPGASGIGNTGNVVRYEARYTYTPMSPLTAQMFGNTKLLTGITYGKNGV